MSSSFYFREKQWMLRYVISQLYSNKSFVTKLFVCELLIPLEMFCKINVAYFTGKQLCWSLFLIRFQSLTWNLTKKGTLTQVDTFIFLKNSVESTVYVFYLVACPNWMFSGTRDSRLQIFYKTGVLKSFAKFTGKHLCWSIILTKLQSMQSLQL